MPSALLEYNEPGVELQINREELHTSLPAWLWWAMFAVLGLMVHGYHPFSEDAAVYVPAIKKQLDATLYSGGADFFLLPARFSFFSNWVALSVRLLHLPLTYALLAWYLVALIALVAACWSICTACFQQRSAALFGTAAITALLTLPVANSALLIFDPYLTSRSMSTPILLWCVYLVLKRRYVPAFVLLGIAVLVHPLMAGYGTAFTLLLIGVQHSKWKPLALVGCLALLTIALFGIFVRTAPLNASYQAAMATRPYFFVSQWKWFELAGVVIPLAIFGYLGRDKRVTLNTRTCALAVSIYGTFFLLFAVLIDRMPGMVLLAKFQPMRSFHLIYILLFLLPVNLLVLRLSKRMRAIPILLLAAVMMLMFLQQRNTFPASAHIEAPWRKASDPWRQGFDWVRANTPKNAVFALDADYMERAGEDRVGFRAYAERDALADTKDGGVAALFPSLAARWETEAHATTDMGNEKALRKLGATWIVTSKTVPKNSNCPFRNSALAVCALELEPDVGKVSVPGDISKSGTAAK